MAGCAGQSWTGRIRAACVAVMMLAGGAGAYPAIDAHHGRPAPRVSDDVRCSDNGRDCIRRAHYVTDVCTMIERNAAEHGLDPAFVARLLWKESRFEPSAISPAGAQGIAQFMPGTADLYRLDDPFNPAQAIHKASWYLRLLTDRFGNIGLAAVAYNGGENRAARFVAQQTTLPFETIDYVESITGFSAHRWRDNPPADSELKLALSRDHDFHPACVELAGNRTLREFNTQPRVFPWGVILASHPSQSGAAQQVARLNRTLRPIMDDGTQVGYVRKRLTGNPRPVYTAQIGYESRARANAFCARFQSMGGRCIVLKN
ncbi:lytic transglycosylase domain-containing protein [Paracoccus sp. (in: a-proteobacteria)]|uniref:lytic transglycosylase domain-containing protein n=1 Tax=Paracoccus sp. TaxID=267 RepID=UPI0026DF687D|nr:lytic transglycosylase domain-containing protein [Paracoccus sp. (in: a-proteobacteria)]MDO5647723.1 lytic transglycosylase domain-containing protein [Paracoccus sp. (in: a-proteobacteria)]